jgi:hypothetical protein
MSSLVTTVTHRIPWVLRAPAEAIIGEVRLWSPSPARHSMGVMTPEEQRSDDDEH